jgi:FkbM family methyltransferase
MIKSFIKDVLRPFYRIYVDLKDRATLKEKGANGRDIYRTVFGDLFWLDKNNFIDQCIIKYSCFEKDSTLTTKKILKSGDVVLDIGANIGYYTVFMSKIIGKDGKVLCFEPTKYYRDVLKKNVQVNKIENCEIFDYGISDKNFKQKIYIGGSTATMHWVGKDKPIEEEEIYLKSLDEVDLSLTKLDFIKIDVDGHEPAVLKGAMNTINKYKPIILLEMSHLHYLKYGVNAFEFYDFLRDNFFNIYTDTLQEVTSRDDFLLKFANFDNGKNMIISLKKLNDGNIGDK